MVVYRVTPPGAESGVQAGESLLQGLPDARSAAIPPCASRSSPIPTTRRQATPCALKARDEAGNEVVAGFNLKVFPRKFRTRTSADRRRVPAARSCPRS